MGPQDHKGEREFSWENKRGCQSTRRRPELKHTGTNLEIQQNPKTQLALDPQILCEHDGRYTLGPPGALGAEVPALGLPLVGGRAAVNAALG